MILGGGKTQQKEFPLEKEKTSAETGNGLQDYPNTQMEEDLSD